MNRKKSNSGFPFFILYDLAALGALLLVFAMFHHVLPKNLTPLYVVSDATPSPSAASDDAGGVADEVQSTSPSSPYVSASLEGYTLEDSYESENVSVALYKSQTGTGDDAITCYVADIVVQDITCLKTAFAGGAYAKNVRDSLISMSEGSVLSMSGDYYGIHESGVVIRNGVLYRDASTSSDICVIYKDGTMKTFSGEAFSAEAEMEKGAWQAWVFGPSLLSADGEALTSFSASRRITSANPRAAIGYISPNHFLFVVVDGRMEGYSRGMTLQEMSQLFCDLGCTCAYNLDGGNSACMAFDSALVNQPSGGGRDLSDCILISDN